MSHQLPPFGLNLRPSRLWLALVLLAVVAFSAVVLRYLPLAWSALLPLPVLLGLGCLRANGWWHGRQAVRRLEVDAAGRLTLWFGTTAVAAQVLDDSFVSPWLVVLNVKAEGRRHAVMLWPDSTDAESLRRLRVYLLWFEGQPPLAATESYD
ncbi:protein YgfX [Paludibacterium denitrificans]|uniref:Toxin CptA n=1 Tax=Paludibacterium denitrificans TaxID=2675226 RepID=A0A844GBF7_9NEIS|nr:protein YgfX [Paludibacterium denitrificans]MTD33836.1 hypothetical protein [Paludibacterium denitrificans]